MPGSRHCEERKRRSNPALAGLLSSSGLLRGAGHRAGHFGPGPLVRNDGTARRPGAKVYRGTDASVAIVVLRTIWSTLRIALRR